MTEPDAVAVLREIHQVITAVRAGDASQEQLLSALAALRVLRDELGSWEPQLIAAARAGGTSWTALAPALGVASRQAAERRYLRLQPSTTGEGTGEARVDAQRDRRAGDRAVAAWAHENSAFLRKLAGQISTAGGFGATAQPAMDRLGDALGDNDAAALLPRLAEAGPHLAGQHGEFADRVRAIAEQTDQIRRDAIDKRREQRR